MLSTPPLVVSSNIPETPSGVVTPSASTSGGGSTSTGADHTPGRATKRARGQDQVLDFLKEQAERDEERDRLAQRREEELQRREEERERRAELRAQEAADHSARLLKCFERLLDRL